MLRFVSASRLVVHWLDIPSEFLNSGGATGVSIVNASPLISDVGEEVKTVESA